LGVDGIIAEKESEEQEEKFHMSLER